MICVYQEYDDTFFPEMNSKGQRTDVFELIFQFLIVHLKTWPFKVWGNCLKIFYRSLSVNQLSQLPPIIFKENKNLEWL